MKDLVERAIESARCRIYRLQADEELSVKHQKKVENQVELMMVTINALEAQKKIKEWIEEHKERKVIPLGDEWVEVKAIVEFLERFMVE
jgi:hypothetical protein